MDNKHNNLRVVDEICTYSCRWAHHRCSKRRAVKILHCKPTWNAATLNVYMCMYGIYVCDVCMSMQVDTCTEAHGNYWASCSTTLHFILLRHRLLLDLEFASFWVGKPDPQPKQSSCLHYPTHPTSTGLAVTHRHTEIVYKC